MRNRWNVFCHVRVWLIVLYLVFWQWVIEVIWVGSLSKCCGLCLVLLMGMIVARFQRWGIVLVFRAVLYMFLRYLIVSGPTCLRCLMSMPSGAVELLFVLFENDFINFRKKNTIKWKLELFPTIHIQKALKHSSTLHTPPTSRKLPKVRMVKIDKIGEFAKREKTRTFDNLSANHAPSG